MYCVRCRKKTENGINPQRVVSKNGRPMLRSTCAVYGFLKSQFVSMKEGGDLASWITSKTSNIKLPWTKYPGEMHLPGMNFAGPGTRLDLRTDSSGRPKSDSLPVDIVDDAAYRHDMAYAAFQILKHATWLIELWLANWMRYLIRL